MSAKVVMRRFHKTQILFPACVLALLLPETLSAQVYEDVHPCDEYAAHPNDPHRWAAGVLDEDIIPGPAVKFCREAVAEHSETARFDFQLGRALWAANRIDEGTDVFHDLEEQYEYGPVYAYLADAYMYGLGSLEADEELAVALYQIAAEDGFTPAAEVLAALAEPPSSNGSELATSPTVEQSSSSGQTDQVLTAQPQPDTQETAFNPNQYTQPKILRALYSGDLSSLAVEGSGRTNYAGISNDHIYIATFHREFAGTVNFKDQSCVALYDPSITKKLDSKIVNRVTGGSGGRLENSLNRGAEAGFEMLGELLQDFSQGGVGGLAQTQQNMVELGEQGGIDAARLISNHGCQSETVQRIYKNIRAYAFGREGVPSPEEAERREQAAIQKAAEEEEARQAALRNNAKDSCVAQWQQEPLCLCMVETLDQHGISDGEWQMVGGEFTKVVSLSGRYDGLRDGLRACRS